LFLKSEFLSIVFFIWYSNGGPQIQHTRVLGLLTAKCLCFLNGIQVSRCRFSTSDSCKASSSLSTTTGTSVSPCYLSFYSVAPQLPTHTLHSLGRTKRGSRMPCSLMESTSCSNLDQYAGAAQPADGASQPQQTERWLESFSSKAATPLNLLYMALFFANAHFSVSKPSAIFFHNSNCWMLGVDIVKGNRARSISKSDGSRNRSIDFSWGAATVSL